MFNPYAGVKTSILFLDKTFAKKTGQVLFLKVEKDGYELGAQRKPLCNDNGDKPEYCPKHSDLPAVLNNLQTWQKAVLDGNPDTFHPETASALLVPTIRLAEDDDFNLSANRYQEVVRSGKQTHEMVMLGSILELSGGKVGNRIDVPVLSITMNYGLIDQDEKFKRRIASKDIAGYKLVHRNEMVVGFPIDEGVIGFQQKYDAAAVSPAYDIWKLKKEEINLDFLETILRSDRARQLYRGKMRGTAGRRRTIEKKDFLAIEIPLPPLETQRQIVDEIAAHQRIIDGARQVVEGWKPDLELDNNVETAKLEDVCDVRTGKLNANAAKEDGKYPFFTCSKEVFKIDIFAFDCEAILLSGNNASGDFDVKRYKGKFNAYQRTYVITIKNEYANRLDYQILQTTLENNLASLKYQSIGGLTKYLTLGMITSIEIPLPPLEIQREIVERIERERAIVEGNRELIRLYEEKVKKVIERVWEG